MSTCSTNTSVIGWNTLWRSSQTHTEHLKAVKGWYCYILSINLVQSTGTFNNPTAKNYSKCDKFCCKAALKKATVWFLIMWQQLTLIYSTKAGIQTSFYRTQNDWDNWSFTSSYVIVKTHTAACWEFDLQPTGGCSKAQLILWIKSTKNCLDITIYKYKAQTFGNNMSLLLNKAAFHQKYSEISYFFLLEFGQNVMTAEISFFV